MESEYKIKGVIFARAWFDAAITSLSDTDRLKFYDATFDYAFSDVVRSGMSPAVQMAFAMVRPFIDQDKTKYQERCERNRANARGGKRVAASGTQSLPVATNTNTNSNTNTNNNTNTISLSEEREKFLVVGMFFARGALQPVAEMNKFWDYYESLGWKNNKGAEIKRKSAAARMWNLQSGVTTQALAPRVAWFQAISRCDYSDSVIFDNLVNVIPREGTLHLLVRENERFAAVCEEHYIGALQAYAAAYSCTSVVYDPAG